MKDIKEMIAIMTAYDNGETIEFLRYGNTEGDWGINHNHIFNWDRYDYKVREEVVLPCPFCGAEGEFLKGIDSNYEYRCSADAEDCALNPISDWYETKDKALEAWNRRYVPAI